MTNDEDLPPGDNPLRAESLAAEKDITRTVDYLRSVLGDAFMDWVLAEPSATLTARQQQVANTLADVLQQHITKNPETPIGLVASLLASYHPDLGTTLINYCRQYAGGSIEMTDEDSGDDLLSAFMSFAGECYGEMLLPASPFRGGPDFFHYVKTQTGQRLARAIRNEGIFPLGTELDSTALGDIGAAAEYIRSQAPGRFASDLIRCSWNLARLDTGSPTLAQLAAKVPIALDQLRSSFSGQPTAVVAVASLTGIRLPGDAEISGSWGRIRSARPEDHPPSFRDLVNRRTTTTTDTGEQIEISDAGDVIFETTVHIKVDVNDENTGWSSHGVDDDFGDLIDRVRLAFALSVTRSTRPIVFCVWAMTLLPMSHLEPFPSIDPQFMAGRVPTLLTTEELATWERWINIVMTADTSRLKVAMTRTLRAMTERRDPSDKLIDAVIAWESLFGATNESTLRVSASLARLLHPSEDREAARSFYGKIYQARSDIVHANETKTTLGQIEEYGRAAIEASLRTMTYFLTTRGDLLHLKSSTRSTRVILGTEGEPAPPVSSPTVPDE